MWSAHKIHRICKIPDTESTDSEAAAMIMKCESEEAGVLPFPCPRRSQQNATKNTKNVSEDLGVEGYQDLSAREKGRVVAPYKPRIRNSKQRSD